MTPQERMEALQREAEWATVTQILVHQFERCLGRPLRDDERASLRTRIETLGPERLGDIVLDLSVDELAA